jgi:hypothetical protein
MSEKLVKVKILKNVGTWMEGDEVEVTQAQAQAMCTIRKKHNGYELINHRTAITMDEFNKIKELPVDLGGLTVEEAKAMGVKNTTVVPKQDLERPFHPGFVETKDPAEMASSKVSVEINANHSSNRKKVS